MNKIFAVFSPSGGVGVSTVAVHLAHRFAEKSETAIVDTHSDFSNIGSLLKTNASLPQDRLPVAINLNSPFIPQLTVTGQNKLKFFPAPPSTVSDLHDWKNHFSNCQKVFQFTVIDLPSTFLAPELQAGLDIADTIILLTENHWSKIAATKAFLEGSPDSVRDKCRVVINKTSWQPKAIVDEIHAKLGQSPFHEIAVDPSLLGKSKLSVNGAFANSIKLLLSKLLSEFQQS